MPRVLLFLLFALAVLVVVKAIAPFILVAAIGLVLLAWKRPDMVGKIAQADRLASVPASIRETPMRFSGSILAVAIGIVVLSAPIGASADEPAVTPGPSTAAALATASPTVEPMVRPTTRPTARATPRATVAPMPDPTPVFGEEPTGPTQVGTVVGIVDGDTIDVEIDGETYRVRYIGMDTPEVHSGEEWMGPEAAAANASLVEGQEVVLEKDVSETDQFDRLLRYVWIDEGDGWLLVNLELLRLGVAQIATYPPDVKYADNIYLPAQQGARDAGIGLWGVAPTPVPTPEPTAAPTAATILPVAPPSNCHPSYDGGCLAIGKGDYDCAGGSGNGPNYIAGPIYIVGHDEFELDRDGDGVACEG